MDTYCATYVPVYTSRSDTEETKRQVDKNNAVWLERCENDPDATGGNEVLAAGENG